MRFYLSVETNIMLKALSREILEECGIDFSVSSEGYFMTDRELSEEQQSGLKTASSRYKMNIITNSRKALIQRVKDIVDEYIMASPAYNVKLSACISSMTGLSYPYIAKVFTEETTMSIEKYYMIARVERAKHMILFEDATLEQIAARLQFSNMPHLSNQFKSVTGLTITTFRSFIKRRNSRF